MGKRAEHLNRITTELGTEEHRRRQDKISAKTCGRLYEKLTGNKPRWEKGKAWHQRQILKKTGIETPKTFHGTDVQFSENTLQKLSEKLCQR